MPINEGEKYSVRKIPEHISVYDGMPKEIRDILKYAPMSVNANSAKNYADRFGISGLKARIDQLVGQNALAAYGPDHPQAQ